MLTTATLGMLGYGLFALVGGLVDLVGQSWLEPLADLASIVFGVLLVLAAPLVRVSTPGGLALAMGAMLGLQALSLHNAVHLYGEVVLPLQLARGAFAATLVLLAYFGAPRVDASELQ